jgi:hypothetical protein
MKKVIFAAIMLAASVAYPRAGWTRTYGGDNGEVGIFILESSDGNYIVLGGTTSFGAGGNDIWLLKVDQEGDTLWTKTYGDLASDWASWMEETSDGGYIIIGGTKSFGAGENDIWLIKTDSNGNILWTHTYGGEEEDWASFVGQTVDSGYIIIGETESFGPCNEGNIWVIKTDSAGDTLLTHYYGDTLYNNLDCANKNRWGGYIMVGAIWSVSDEHYSMIEVDYNGYEMWSYPYYEGPCTPTFIAHVQPGHWGHVLAGQAYHIDDVSGGPALWICETSTMDGYQLWSARYGGYDNGEYYEMGNCIQPTSDSGYIVVADPWTLLKTDKNGDSLWTRIYDGYAYYVLPTSDGGYLVTGSKGGDLWLLKTDANGDTIPPAVEEQVMDSSSDWDVCSPVGTRVTLRYSDYPQGFHASVFDASGRKVDELHSAHPSGTITWGDDASRGVYFIRQVSDNSTISYKVVLVR